MAAPSLKLTGSVGKGGKNFPQDVALVQSLLNKTFPVPYALLKVNGVADASTIGAIVEFQRRVVKAKSPDGRIDVGGLTARKLAPYLTSPQAMGPFLPSAWLPIGPPNRAVPSIVGFEPTGKTLQQCVDAFVADAASRHGVTISITADFRKAGDAQKWHTAHMFYYNSFASRKPRVSELENGRNVIAWSHISSATLVWHTSLQWADFLRDKQGQVPVKSADGKSWVSGHEPDKAKSRERAYQILSSAGIGTADGSTLPHSAMVASGHDGCGEPCKCGGNRSRHISGMAFDLNKTAMKTLESKVTPATEAGLNAYLKTFGLQRPMKSEPWHVEAL